jgi:hypothetical protein
VRVVHLLSGDRSQRKNRRDKTERSDTNPPGSAALRIVIAAAIATHRQRFLVVMGLPPGRAGTQPYTKKDVQSSWDAVQLPVDLPLPPLVIPGLPHTCPRRVAQSGSAFPEAPMRPMAVFKIGNEAA